jgi:carboxyl-terminal processing protease
MTHRIASLSLLFALAAPGLHAQTQVVEAPRVPVVDALADAVEAISTMHMDGFSDSTLWEAAIDGMIAALNDPYAELFTPVEAEVWEEETTGNYSGIGLQITPLNDEVTVTAVFRSTPAMQVGIVVGDVLVGVNEHDASGWTTGMAADSIRGPVGSNVLVKVKRAGYPDPIALDITRAEVHVPAVHYGVLESGIGYVVLDRVARNAAREMNAALAELGSTSGLIIDLRRNPGGFLDESLMLADLFLKPGSTLASTVQRIPGSAPGEMSTDSFDDRWPQLVPDLPMVILVDRFTASGAEILAGALQDYDRAIVLGERSFGKGVVQTVMPLPGNRRLRFTTGSWHTPLGRSLQRSRDALGRPMEEDLDTFPRVTTAAGRTLVNGGGIFPDLEIEDDTLKIIERELITEVNEKQIPLGLRLAELGFDAAAARRDTNQEPSLDAAEFDGLVTLLRDAGLSEELLGDETILEYLNWRGRINVAQRMEDIGAEADFRMERDPVLTEAVRLILTTMSQAGLIEAVDGESGRGGGQEGPTGR